MPTTTAIGFTAVLDISGYPGVNTAIAVDAKDKIHICYYNYLDKTLKYTTNVFGTWTTEDVETIDYLVDVADCSIAVGTVTSYGYDTATVTFKHYKLKAKTTVTVTVE